MRAERYITGSDGIFAGDEISPPQDLIALKSRPHPETASVTSWRRALSIRCLSHSLRLLDWLSVFLAGFIIIHKISLDAIGADPSEAVRVTIFAATLFVVIGEMSGAYVLMNALSKRRCWPPLANAWCVTMLFLSALFITVGRSTGQDEELLVCVAGTSLACLVGARSLALPVLHRLRRAGYFNTRVVVLGAGTQATELARYILNNDRFSISLLGYFDDLTADERAAQAWLDDDAPPIPLLGGMAELMHEVRLGRIDKVLVAIPWSAKVRLQACLGRLSTTPVDVQLAPEWAGFEWARRPLFLLGDLPILSLVERPLSGWRRLLKTTQDRLLAGLALLVLAPLMIMIAVVIKLDSPGPIFFRQLREGYNCKPFTILKFRTMYLSSCQDTHVIQARRRDPRITRVGAFLRRTSIDELPQLFNVLSGTMSLVGPRPHAASTRAGGKLFNEIEASYARRHNVKPGLTGWAQVCGWRGETTSEDMLIKRLQHDLYYVENCSLWFDLYILARTAITILFQRTAY